MWGNSNNIVIAGNVIDISKLSMSTMEEVQASLIAMLAGTVFSWLGWLIGLNAYTGYFASFIVGIGVGVFTLAMAFDEKLPYRIFNLQETEVMKLEDIGQMVSLGLFFVFAIVSAGKHANSPNGILVGGLLGGFASFHLGLKENTKAE